jgi:hypothetical protein
MVGTVVIDEIRRVGGEQDRPLAIHQATDIGGERSVAAEQSGERNWPAAMGPPEATVNQVLHVNGRWFVLKDLLPLEDDWQSGLAARTMLASRSQCTRRSETI